MLTGGNRKIKMMALVGLGLFFSLAFIDYGLAQLSCETGWREVPGDGATSAGPAATVFNGQLYVFIRGCCGDNRIYVNVLSRDSWSGWREVPGNGQTYSEPAATAYRDRLYLFVTGIDQRIYVNVLGREGWSGWSPVPTYGFLTAGLASTVFNDRLYLFTADASAPIFGDWYAIIYFVFDGSDWIHWDLAAVTRVGQAATVLDNRLYLFSPLGDRGEPSEIVYSLFDGSQWTLVGFIPGRGQTDAQPAVANLGNGLWVFIKDLDGRILGNRANPAWSGWREVPGSGLTISKVGATAYNPSGDLDQLYLFVRGINDRIYLNVCQ